MILIDLLPSLMLMLVVQSLGCFCLFTLCLGIVCELIRIAVPLFFVLCVIHACPCIFGNFLDIVSCTHNISGLHSDIHSCNFVGLLPIWLQFRDAILILVLGLCFLDFVDLTSWVSILLNVFLSSFIS